MILRGVDVTGFPPGEVRRERVGPRWSESLRVSRAEVERVHDGGGLPQVVGGLRQHPTSRVQPAFGRRQRSARLPRPVGRGGGRAMKLSQLHIGRGDRVRLNDRQRGEEP